MPDRHIRTRISGRVQGVSYRAWTQENAQELGLSGWVRNLSGGDVEAVFSGPDQAVQTMLGRLKQGPRMAQVSAIDVNEAEGPPPTGFEITG
ncbi:acylphosphatase [Roseivivax sp. THAF30]|jgi:acylphosphatase|uniref:acylphosphatase n=1 Tax=Roseivivax sp. THAF30 TaxID=2587852 RepID=UPI001267A0BC|nr:acylphosphatase [Roseivivax sp. THAF30]QFT64265.1 Acylphosphatase [Roseivivax sp. THAF30]